MRFLRQKRLISSLLYYYHAHPDQLSLDRHHSFSVVSTLPFRPTNNNYLLDKPIAIPEGLKIRWILLFTGGWAYNWQGGGLISGSLRYVIGLDFRFEITVNGM